MVAATLESLSRSSQKRIHLCPAFCRQQSFSLAQLCFPVQDNLSLEFLYAVSIVTVAVVTQQHKVFSSDQPSKFKKS